MMGYTGRQQCHALVSVDKMFSTSCLHTRSTRGLQSKTLAVFMLVSKREYKLTGLLVNVCAMHTKRQQKIPERTMLREPGVHHPWTPIIDDLLLGESTAGHLRRRRCRT